MHTITETEIEKVRAELRRLEHARAIYNEVIQAARLMGMEQLENRLTTATRQMATAEGEIEQAIFGARGAA